VLQVAYRHNLGVNVDYKAAQREGEPKAQYHTISLFRAGRLIALSTWAFPVVLACFFTARQGVLDALEDATGN
jgi:hypothetical protein